MNTSDARKVYADIIDMPHHQSPMRQHMSLYDRAAQFSPFAALTGYDDMIKEEARLTDDMKELSETDFETLNQQIALISKEIEERNHPEVTVTYFIPDKLKSGGRYEKVSGTIKRIDSLDRRLILYGENMISDGLSINLSMIYGIEGELFPDSH